jgi:hypothetical protein
MKHKIQIRYAIWRRSFWEVEAPDQATAEQMATAALNGDIEEGDGCRRTEPDREEMTGPSDEQHIEYLQEMDALRAIGDDVTVEF